MDEEELYDEFGNLIGDPLDSDAESDNVSLGDASDSPKSEAPAEPMEVDALVPVSQLSKTFNAETVVVRPQDAPEDAPVIEVKTTKKVKADIVGDDFEVSYSHEYMKSVMDQLPERIRNVAIIGDLHSGKTSLVDMLVGVSHTIKGREPERFTDNHALETSRKMTIKLSPITLLVPDLGGTLHVATLLDTPGHPNFRDEAVAALLVAESAVLVVDAVEGFSPRAKALASRCLELNVPITVVLNKIDRLILELRLPPADTYHKLKHTIDSINAFLHDEGAAAIGGDRLLFASATHRLCFSTTSFAQLYGENSDVVPSQLAPALWGNIFYNPDTHKLSKRPPGPRTFVHFVLEPLYKLFGFTLVADSSGSGLNDYLWENFGKTLHKSLFKQESSGLLKDVFKTVFSSGPAFMDVVKRTPPPSTPETSQVLVAKVFKLTETADASGFQSLVRVYKGTLRVGERVRVLGENGAHDEDDRSVEVVDQLYIPVGRYRVAVNEAGPGQIVVVEGIESIITKSATLCSVSDEHFDVFPPVDHQRVSLLKVAVEPERPSDLPKLLEGFRKVNRAYLSLIIKVEESGEYVVFAPGEFYLDCVLHDLRLFFTDDIDIKVSDPMTKFSETVRDTSVTIIPVKLAKKHVVSIIAEPMDHDVGHAIETGKISLAQPAKVTAKILREEFNWDALAARSLWATGPDRQLPSVLLDDTIEGESDKAALREAKEFVTTGFELGVTEGPLCGEPVRSVRFRILSTQLGDVTGGAQIIPMIRNAIHAGFLTASPKLLEPYYKVTATCKQPAIGAIRKLLKRRRGDVTFTTPVPSTPLFEVEGYVPIIDSAGLESDVRLQTQGLAMCFLEFDSWDIVPGDPLDPDVELPAMKPVPRESLARDFVMKTRRRKGLTGEPTLQKFIDPDLFNQLRESGIVN